MQSLLSVHQPFLIKSGAGGEYIGPGVRFWLLLTVYDDMSKYPPTSSLAYV